MKATMDSTSVNRRGWVSIKLYLQKTNGGPDLGYESFFFLADLWLSGVLENKL